MFKYKHETTISVRGFDFIVKSKYAICYNGREEHDGFDVFLGLKKVGYFVGYPTPSDLEKFLA
jgi:hypothetical protein